MDQTLLNQKKKGFGSMDPEKARLLRQKGGAASPANFKNLTPEQRAEYGRRGGSKSRKTK